MFMNEIIFIRGKLGENHGVQLEEADLSRSNNRHVVSMRHGGGDLLWKAIGNLGVVSSQPDIVFKKKIRDLGSFEFGIKGKREGAN